MDKRSDAVVTTDTKLQALWDRYRERVAAWEADGTPFEGPSVVERDEAEDRFIQAKTTSPLGILLKLEHAAETDNLAVDPDMTVSRLVLGLIGDLKSELGVL